VRSGPWPWAGTRPSGPASTSTSPGPEVVYVVSGELIDGDTVLRAGDAAVHPAGSSHSPRSETGCRLLVFYPEG
jgi:hypothetical protein